MLNEKISRKKKSRKKISPNKVRLINEEGYKTAYSIYSKSRSIVNLFQ